MDPNAIDRAEHRRDRRLRRRVLQVLGAARVRPEFGWATGRFVYDLVDGALPGGEAFDGDDHMLALVRDLASAATCRSGMTAGTSGSRRGWTRPATASRTTARRLLAECVDPDPLIEDPRLSPAGERAGRGGRAGHR